jgi:hypothetical protein
MAGARHVLNDELRVAWNILSHVTDDKAGPQIIEIARRSPHNNLDGFSLVKGSLSMGTNVP